MTAFQGHPGLREDRPDQFSVSIKGPDVLPAVVGDNEFNYRTLSRMEAGIGGNQPSARL